MMKRVNRDGPPPRGDVAVPPRLDAAAFRAALERNDLIVDLRRADEFAARHVRGAVSIPLTRAFVGYAGWVLPYDRDVYFLTGGTDDAAARQAASELSMIGLDRVAGWFGGDVLDALASEGSRFVSSQQIAPRDVAPRMTDGMLVVDVRSTEEWRSGHIAGSQHIPLGRLVAQMADAAKTRPVLLVCESGSRSLIGASLLTAAGFSDVTNLTGGIAAWRREGLPLEVDTVVFANAT
jgi:hydroxyacylglutathione hydrolase